MENTVSVYFQLSDGKDCLPLGGIEKLKKHFASLNFSACTVQRLVKGYHQPPTLFVRPPVKNCRPPTHFPTFVFFMHRWFIKAHLSGVEVRDSPHTLHLAWQDNIGKWKNGI